VEDDGLRIVERHQLVGAPSCEDPILPIWREQPEEEAPAAHIKSAEQTGVTGATAYLNKDFYHSKERRAIDKRSWEATFSMVLPLENDFSSYRVVPGEAYRRRSRIVVHIRG
jgi:hypothetical protein